MTNFNAEKPGLRWIRLGRWSMHRICAFSAWKFNMRRITWFNIVFDRYYCQQVRNRMILVDVYALIRCTVSASGERAVYRVLTPSKSFLYFRPLFFHSLSFFLFYHAYPLCRCDLYHFLPSRCLLSLPSRCLHFYSMKHRVITLSEWCSLSLFFSATIHHDLTIMMNQPT